MTRDSQIRNGTFSHIYRKWHTHKSSKLSSLGRPTELCSRYTHKHCSTYTNITCICYIYYQNSLRIHSPSNYQLVTVYSINKFTWCRISNVAWITCRHCWNNSVQGRVGRKYVHTLVSIPMYVHRSPGVVITFLLREPRSRIISGILSRSEMWLRYPSSDVLLNVGFSNVSVVSDFYSP